MGTYVISELVRISLDEIFKGRIKKTLHFLAIFRRCFRIICCEFSFIESLDMFYNNSIDI